MTRIIQAVVIAATVGTVVLLLAAGLWRLAAYGFALEHVITEIGRNGYLLIVIPLAVMTGGAAFFAWLAILMMFDGGDEE